MKFRNKDIACRYHGRAGHPSVVVAKYSRTKTYGSFGLTSNPVEHDSGKVRANISIPDNPNPNSSRKSYISKSLKEDLQSEYSDLIPGWKLSKKDLAPINRRYREVIGDRRLDSRWKNRFRGPYKKSGHKK